MNITRHFRRRFLKVAALAALWTKIVPESTYASTQGASTAPSTSGDDPLLISEAPPDVVQVLYQELPTSADVAALLERTGTSLVPGDVMASQRMASADVSFDFIAVPYTLAETADVEEMYIMFGTVTATSGPSAGASMPAALGVYADGTVYAAAQGQLARALDPSTEASVSQMFFDQVPDVAPTTTSLDSGSLRRVVARKTRTGLPGVMLAMQAEAPPCNDPRVVDCQKLCRSACASAGLGLGVGCVLAGILCVGAIIISGGIASVVTCAVAVLVCGRAYAIQAGCSGCRTKCQAFNKAICDQAAGRL